jgi:hypothetical protein
MTPATRFSNERVNRVLLRRRERDVAILVRERNPVTTILSRTTLAPDQDVPPELRVTLAGPWSRRWLLWDRDDASFTLADETKLLASNGLDVLVRTKIELQSLEFSIPVLKVTNLRTELALLFAKLLTANGVKSATD